MTLSEFLNSKVAKEYREENFQRMKDELRKICIDENWPIANNETALDAVTNDNIDHILIDIYEKDYKNQ
ncbi:MAG: hypothetical protein EHM58_09610 [Ignavibacteriae bacterium]|nr:MAG: hypothetical protein EHM58_09610 [Ignavibacteriota bacterium]